MGGRLLRPGDQVGRDDADLTVGNAVDPGCDASSRYRRFDHGLRTERIGSIATAGSSATTAEPQLRCPAISPYTARSRGRSTGGTASWTSATCAPIPSARCAQAPRRVSTGSSGWRQWFRFQVATRRGVVDASSSLTV